MVSLIISDVLGDPLETIASGPTVPDSSTPRAALDVLERYSARAAGISPAVFKYLEEKAKQNSQRLTAPGEAGIATNLVIGNNATAVSPKVQCIRKGQPRKLDVN